jgi:hypothetical protein
VTDPGIRPLPLGCLLPGWLLLLVVLGALAVWLLRARPAAAQLLDSDRCVSCRDSYYHTAAGAALDVAVRTGVIAKPWRTHALGRVSLVILVGAVYEGVETFAAWENGQLGKPGHGFGLKDLGCDLAGALAVELVVALGRKVLR